MGSRLITIIDPQKLVSSLEGVQVLQEFMYSHQYMMAVFLGVEALSQ
ncbi:hypothetical protein AB1K18_17770 [Peribacillus simplex]